jgi:hypothetical protein
MNNAVNHLVTVSAHQRASKTYREERSRRKPCNPHEAKEKHQGSRQEQTTKDAVTDKRLLQKSVPKETVHNTKPWPPSTMNSGKRSWTRPESQE